MNQNDKFHSGITPELNEEQLESVSGGTTTDENNHYYFDPPPSEPDTLQIRPIIPLHSIPSMLGEDPNADIAGHV